jgi:soluble lytic murein transglycosylase-like protein
MAGFVAPTSDLENGPARGAATPPARRFDFVAPEADIAPAPTAPKSAPTGPSFFESARNLVDRAGLAIGVIDPAEYRGYNTDGTARTAADPAQAPSISAPGPRAWTDIMAGSFDRARSMAGEGEVGALSRGVSDALNLNDAFDRQRFGLTPQEAEARRDKRMVDTVRAEREVWARQDAADPVWQPDGGVLPNVGRVIAQMGGDTLGNINPTMLIGPGASWLPRVAWQTGISGGIDAGLQANEMREGIQDEFDPARLGFNAASGGLFQGAGELVGAGIGRLRGGAPDAPAPDLQPAAPLEGVAPNIMDLLASRGVTPEQAAAMSPEFQAMAVERLGGASPVAPAVPAIGPDIIAAPEGNILADDTGAIAGLTRQRAAMDEILGRAQERAADNPTLAAILESNARTQQQVASIWERLAEVDASGQREPFPVQTIQSMPPVQPGRLPDPATVGPSPSRTFERMIGAESGGRQKDAQGRTIKSPVGATGIAQVMPATGPEAAKLAGLEWDPARFENDAAYNRSLGQAYYKEMLRQFSGDNTKAVAAYNAGPGRIRAAVAKHGAQWADHIPAETKGYIAKVLGNDPLPTGPAEAAPFLTADDGSPAMTRRRNEDDGLEAIGQRAADFEDLNAAPSPTRRQMDDGDIFETPTGQFGPETRGAASYEAPMGTGSSARPFRPVGDDPAGQAGFWEQRANMQADELRAAFEEAIRGGERMGRERQASADPADRFKTYDQKPAQGDDGFWRFTDDGFVAGAKGQPVAFRNAKDAAKWAAANKMGGDLEPVVWKSNSTRIVLRRRDGSTYGTAQPTGPAEPAAGRSTDTSQRALAGPEAPTEPGFDLPPGGDTSPPAPSSPPAPFRGGGGNAATAEAGPPRERVTTDTGTEIDTEFQVVEARDLITSSDAGFDQRFQPRDRAGRSSSDAQIADIAARLDPQQLGRARLASQGAPIIGPDRMVESGNGRASAIRRAYDMNPERAAEYRRMIDDMGFDTAGMQQPVLVRKRLTEMDDDTRAAFTRDAQGGGTMRMSPTEQAGVDAKALSRDTMKLYRGGDVSSAANRDFVRSFMDGVVSANDRNALQMADGTLSKAGSDRIRAALASKAYGDPRFVEKLLVDENTEIKAIGNVLTDLAPGFSRLKDRIDEGELPPAFDITPQIVEISRLIARTRAEGRPISDFLDQTDIFAGDIDPITEALAGVMLKGEELGTARSAKDMADGLNFYLRDVDASGADLFGGDLRDRATAIVQAAQEMLVARDLAKGEQRGDLFGGSQRAARLGRGPVTVDITNRLSADLRAVTGDDAPLARLLADLVGDDATVRYGRDGMQNRYAVGEADIGTGRAFVRDAGDTETLLHEAIHIAAMGRYGFEFNALRPGDAGSNPARAVLDLFNEARDRLGTSAPFEVKYALTTPDEFLAMSLTNKPFQQWLEKGTLWNRVVDTVRRLLGMEPKWTPMLDRALRAGSDLLDAAGSDPMRRRVRSVEARPANLRKPSILDRVFDRDEMDMTAAGLARAVGDPKAAARSIFKDPKDFATLIAFSNDARIRGIGARFGGKVAELADQMADHFHARSGEPDAAARTYHEAVKRRSAVQLTQALEALDPFLRDTDAQNRIRSLLANPKKAVAATAGEREAAGKLRDLLKDEIAYRKAAGEDIGEVADGYFPRVLDIEKSIKGRDKWLKQATELYRRHGADDPRASAEAWFDHVFDTYAGIDGGIGFSRSSGDQGMGSSSAKSREFGKAADELMSEFYVDDVPGTMASYFNGSARRAEYARRFGMKGEQGSPERKAWEREHDGKTQLKVWEDQMRAALREADGDAEGAMGVIDTAFKSNLGRLGSIGARGSAWLSGLHAWNQVGKLDMTTVTSLTELAAGFVRGGPKYGFQFAAKSLNEFGRLVRGAKDKSDAERWADAVGVGTNSMVNQMLMSRAGMEGISQSTQRLMAKFYKAIGLHQYTEGTRIAAVDMGRKYIDTLVGDLGSADNRTRARAGRYLAELGIKDSKAFSAWIEKGGATIDAVRADKDPMAQAYGTALMRFVNQTIMSPDRAVKPAYANHPVGSLFYSLMSFSFGFKKNVMDRAWRTGKAGIQNADPVMLAPAAGLAILALWSNFVDTQIRGTIKGNKERFEKEDAIDTTMRVLDRSGMTGVLSPLVNAVQGVRYNRDLPTSLAGPIIGDIADKTQKIAIDPYVKNSPNTNTTERARALAIYDAMIEPALDATGARYLRGAAATAGILATGNREGGVLPGDRDAFVDAMAGEKE